MQRELVFDYLRTSGMSAIEANALSHILSEMATKDELVGLEQRLDSRIQAEMQSVRTEVQTVRTEMQSLRADLSWKFIAGLGFLSVLIAVVEFIGS